MSRRGVVIGIMEDGSRNDHLYYLPDTNEIYFSETLTYIPRESTKWIWTSGRQSTTKDINA
jgi:hypothetical protein